MLGKKNIIYMCGMVIFGSSFEFCFHSFALYQRGKLSCRVLCCVLHLCVRVKKKICGIMIFFFLWLHLSLPVSIVLNGIGESGGGQVRKKAIREHFFDGRKEKEYKCVFFSDIKKGENLIVAECPSWSLLFPVSVTSVLFSVEEKRKNVTREIVSIFFSAKECVCGGREHNGRTV